MEDPVLEKLVQTSRPQPGQDTRHELAQEQEGLGRNSNFRRQCNDFVNGPMSTLMHPVAKATRKRGEVDFQRHALEIVFAWSQSDPQCPRPQAGTTAAGSHRPSSTGPLRHQIRTGGRGIYTSLDVSLKNAPDKGGKYKNAIKSPGGN